MPIRPFEPSDADALAALFHASVHQVGIRHYSLDQLESWSPSQADPTRYLRQATGRALFVAVDDDGRPTGYGDLEPDGHIDHLYCRPDMIGTGIGSALCAVIEATARKAGIAILFVEASEGARRFFERCGFGVEARNDFTIDGVPIHNYRMSKPIA